MRSPKTGMKRGNAASLGSAFCQICSPSLLCCPLLSAHHPDPPSSLLAFFGFFDVPSLSTHKKSFLLLKKPG